MANIKEKWYSLVSSDLVYKLDMLMTDHKNLKERLDLQIQITKEHRDAWVTAENKIKRLLQEIASLKKQEPLTRSLDSVRHHASQQAILDLQAEVKYLRQRLKDVQTN